MFKTSNSSIFHKQNIVNHHQISYGLNQIGYSPQNNNSSRLGQKFNISDLQKKLQMFGGMQQVQQDILTQLNRNSHRIDSLVTKVRGFMKLDPIGGGMNSNSMHKKRLSSVVSFSPGPSTFGHNTKSSNGNLMNYNQRASNSINFNNNKVQNISNNVSMRLKDRVQKALKTQEDQKMPSTKTKYIK